MNSNNGLSKSLKYIQPPTHFKHHILNKYKFYKNKRETLPLATHIGISQVHFNHCSHINDALSIFVQYSITFVLKATLIERR